MQGDLNAAEIQKRLDAGKITVFEKPAVVMITGSEGRRGIVRSAGLDWLLLKNNFDEEAVKTDKNSVDTVIKAAEYCKELAFLKLEAVRGLFKNAALITADTVVFNRKLIEKPGTEKEVFDMIRGLNGSRHQVITGVALCDGRAAKQDKGAGGGVKKAEAAPIVFACVSEVLLSGVTDAVIKETIRLENPYACSGGYTIDGVLEPYFKILSGSKHNVIGLPLKEILDRLNIDRLN